MKCKKFIINEQVIFDVNSCELKLIALPNEVIILNSPTARCLQLLLECSGKVVSKDDFLQQVWNARGIVVSQNTFYQNISLLRKSLKKAGLHDDIIVTVRRKGFIVSSDALIEPVEEYATKYEIDSSLPERVSHCSEKITIPEKEINEDVTLSTINVEQSGKTKVAKNKLSTSVTVLLAIFIVIEIVSLLIRYL